MTKNDFINLLAQEMEIPASQAEKAFTAVIKGLTGLLIKGDELTLPGFGKFSVVHKAARTGRNPTTVAKQLISKLRLFLNSNQVML